MVSETVAALGKLDILANVAGIHPDSSIKLGAITLEQWDYVLKVDLTGPFLGTQAVLPVFLKAGGGVIVNVSSVSGLLAGPWPHYNAAKAGVRSLTRSTALLYAPNRIRANAVYPGVIDTALTKDALANPASRERDGEQHPVAEFSASRSISPTASCISSPTRRNSSPAPI